MESNVKDKENVLDYVVTENKPEDNALDSEVLDEETESEIPNEEETPDDYKVPDVLGNNKLGYNIWDTIVKGV